jgi:hypothetical protein
MIWDAALRRPRAVSVLAQEAPPLSRAWNFAQPELPNTGSCSFIRI